MTPWLDLTELFQQRHIVTLTVNDKNEARPNDEAHNTVIQTLTKYSNSIRLQMHFQVENIINIISIPR